MPSGRRISEIIASGPITADLLLRIGTGMAEVIAAAHARGKAFGGLGTATVLVSPAGSVLVLDTAETSLSARREDDLRALGTLLYAMATGLTPHQAAAAARRAAGPHTASETAATGVASEPAASEPGLAPSPVELNPRLPSGLVRLIQRSVHPDAQERFRSAVEIRDALLEVQRAPGSLESLLPAEHVSSSAAVTPPPRPPADERGDEEPEPLEGDEPLEGNEPRGRLPFLD